MALQLYQPSSLLRQFNEEINRLFPEQGDSVFTRQGGSWRPAIDIHETDDEYVLEADVAGIDPENIEITLRGGVLTLSGERVSSYAKTSSEDARSKREPARHIERSYGKFVRRFTLPDGVDEDAIEARAENGVLKVSLPRKEQSQPRKIEIQQS